MSISKVFFGVVLLAVVAYLGYQVYLFAAPGITSEVTTVYTATSDIMTTGFMLRDEKVIPKTEDGIYETRAESGKRIGKDGVIATVYEDGEQADINKEIKSLEIKIERMKSASADLTPGTAELAQLENRIVAAMNLVGMNADIGSGNGVISAKEELAVLLNRKALLTGDEKEYKARISELEKKRSELLGQVSNKVKTQTAEQSGYFVDSADGFENLLTPDKIAGVTVSKLRELESVKPEPLDKEKTLGKLIVGYKWYFSAIVTKEELADLTQGQSVEIKFPFAAGITVPAVVYAISPEEGGSVVLTLRSDIEVPELNLVRNQNVQIIKKSYTGLKVPLQAVRKYEGETGVFVRTGNVVQWRKAEILFSKDNYYILKYDSGNKKSVLLYDEVIVSGKNLYDGKVI